MDGIDEHRNPAMEEDVDEYTDEDMFDEYDAFADDLEDIEGIDDSDEDPDYYDSEGHQSYQGREGPGIFDDLDDDNADEDDEDEENQRLVDRPMEEFLQDLRAAKGYKTKRKGKGRRAAGDAPLTPEVAALMGQANQSYVQGDVDTARRAIERLVQLDATVYGAWKLLGEIYRDKGDSKRALQAWIMAALCKPKETELWLTCAKLSLEQYGPGEQALHCYTKALKHMGKGQKSMRLQIMFSRAILYRDLKWYGKAEDSLNALLRVKPHDFRILKELGKVFLDQDRIQDAIKLYTENANHYVMNGNNQADGGFTWSDLNILAEFYMMAENWKGAIITIKAFGRWLFGRTAETYWDLYLEDDREWDIHDQPRRVQVADYESGKFPAQTYRLPYELYAKLGVCRLRLGQKDEAMMHFDTLLEADPVQYVDIIQDVGNNLLNDKFYDDAIKFYQLLVDRELIYDKQILLNLARCHQELGELEKAEDCYTQLISIAPDDVDGRMQLAVMYENEKRKEEALELVNEIIAIRKQKEEIERARKEGTVQPEPAVLFPTRSRRPARRRANPLSAQQRQELEQKKANATLTKARKLEYLFDRMKSGDMLAVRDWLDTAADLVDEFRNTRAFYPAERNVKFRGFTVTARRRADKQNEFERVSRMQARLQEDLQFQVDEHEEQDTSHLNEWRGITFETWLWIFCQYALTLARYEDPADAYDVLSAAMDANVFFHNPAHKSTIARMQLAVALIAQDAEQLSEYMRSWLTNHQFTPDVYRLFHAVMLACPAGRAAFNSNPNQKYFLRQIKAMDRAVKNDSSISGAAALTGTLPDGSIYSPKEYDVPLLMLYGAILMAGRNYIPALNYFSRCHAIVEAEGHVETLAHIKMHIGIAYLLRGMQRQSMNRQWEVLQGLSFFFEYYDSRTMAGAETQEKVRWTVRQEAEYNLGRCFHQLGLLHLAIPRYKEVLRLSEEFNEGGNGSCRYDLGREAAYNLQNIYMAGGNRKGAEEITEKYLVL